MQMPRTLHAQKDQNMHMLAYTCPILANACEIRAFTFTCKFIQIYTRCLQMLARVSVLMCIVLQYLQNHVTCLHMQVHLLQTSADS